MNVQWWCAAVSRPWTWSWSPYPGVWAALILLVWGHRRLLARTGATAERHHLWALGGGVACLWAGLDWPLAALGASYLASAHVGQFLLVGILAPLLLLLAVPERAYRALETKQRLHALLETLTRPTWAFLLFNGGMILTHWPRVTDAMMAGAWGSFLLDVTWLACGLLFWWPLVAPVPVRDGFHPLLRMGYLALNGLLIRPPFLMMLFSDYPIYGIYELAPPFPGTDPVTDQQLGAALMKLGTAWIMGAGVAVEFLRWARSDRGEEPPTTPRGGPGAAPPVSREAPVRSRREPISPRDEGRG